MKKSEVIKFLEHALPFMGAYTLGASYGLLSDGSSCVCMGAALFIGVGLGYFKESWWGK